MKPTLLVDSNYICYRAMFTIGDLSIGDKGTGVIFGFLNQIQQLAKKFDYPKFVFTWDSLKSARRDVYPEYKVKKREKTQEMIELLEIAKPQFEETRLTILPTIGFKNSFIQTGLESDDLIAKIVNIYPSKEFVIISSDSDLYQLLTDFVLMYDPKKKEFFTLENFIDKYKITPGQWVEVKALGGCKSDNIKGVRGVGEVIAIKYLAGKLTKERMEFIKSKRALISVNRSLVTLPHSKTRPITLVNDEFNFKQFESMCLHYGFQSFLKRGPYEQWKKILS